ncbi:hypothetical protein [Brevundimonas sp.]
MCIGEKPKIAAPVAAKDPAILRNPYLDGLDPILRARSGGVRSLTLRRDGYRKPARPSPITPPLTGNIGGGTGGSMGRNEAQGLGRFGQMLDAVEAKNASDKQNFANNLFAIKK